MASSPAPPQGQQAAPPAKSSRSKRVNVEVPEMVTEMPSEGGRAGGQSTMWLRGRLLGKGGFAAVYELQNMSDGRVVAGKAISKVSLQKSRARQKLETEIAIHRRLKHPSIVKFLYSFEDSKNVYLLLECCSGRTLADLLRSRGRLTDAETADLLRQTILAIQSLHNDRIIHRDLKLSNLFLDQDGRIKVGDFGLACQLAHDGERKTTICGTPNYIAPEVLAGKQGHSYEVDVWSLGVVLYTLLIGKPPFETSDVRSTYRRIRSNAYFFPEGTPISEEAVDLIRQVLRTEPDKRPTLDEMLEHPFFARFEPDVVRGSGGVSSLVTAEAVPSANKAAIQSPFASSAKPSEGDGKGAAAVVHINVWAGGEQSARARQGSGSGALRVQPPASLQVPRGPGLSSNSPTPSAPRGGGGGSSSLLRPDRENSGSIYSGLRDSNIDTMSQCLLSPSTMSTISRAGSTASMGGGGLSRTGSVAASSDNKFDLRSNSNKASLSRPTWTPPLSVNPSPSGTPTASRGGVSKMGSAEYPGSSGAPGMMGSSPTTPVSSLLGQRGYDSDKNKEWDRHHHQQHQHQQRSRDRDLQEASEKLKRGGSSEWQQNAASDSPKGSSSSPGVASLVEHFRRQQSLNDFKDGGRAAAAVSVAASSDNMHDLSKPNKLGDPHRQVTVSVRCDSAALPDCKGQAAAAEAAAADGGKRFASSGSGGSTSLYAAGMDEGQPSSANPQSQGPAVHRPRVWVTKWVDYSSKYGMGYVLSNGAVGVLFNDATKILLLPGRQQYVYLEKPKKTPGGGGRGAPEERLVLNTEDEPPQRLTKKATLLWYFEGYLKGSSSTRQDKRLTRVSGECVGPGFSSEELAASQTEEDDKDTYVRKWLKTKHAVIFRLSNKVIQVDFNDGTEIMLSSEMQSVTYVNKSRVCSTHWLSQLPQDLELLKRLKYSKDILLQLIGGSGSSGV